MPRDPLQDTSLLKGPKVKDKERLLKAREKKLVSEGYQMGRRGGE